MESNPFPERDQDSGILSLPIAVQWHFWVKEASTANLQVIPSLSSITRLIGVS